MHAHAAIFLSMLDPLGEAGAYAEFFGELLLAIVFGMLINSMWNGYFRGRIGADPVRRQTAALRIAMLSLALLLVVAALSWVSLELLRYWGIWLSPVPIAIGMLLDSFVVGSVSGARQELLHLAGIHIDHPKTLRESVARFAWGDVARLWNKSDAGPDLRLEDVPQLAQLVRSEIRAFQGARGSGAPVEPLQSKIVEFIAARAKEPAEATLRHNRRAAVLVAARRTLWAAVVVTGLILHFSH